MKLEVLNINNKHVETLDVTKDFILEKKYNQEVYLAVVAYLASKRQGTSKVKGRSEVKGSTKKPWRQKGTGRARVGTKKSPIWRGGGVVFGPTGNQNYTKKQNKKSYKNAMLTVISQYLKEKRVICYDNFPIKTPQTKAFFTLFKKKGILDKKVLLITKTKNEVIDLSTRNLSKVTYKSVFQVNVYDILNAFWIVLDKEAYIALEKKWGLNE